MAGKRADQFFCHASLSCALSRLPAAWLFGPLVASALFAVRNWYAVELPRSVYIAIKDILLPVGGTTLLLLAGSFVLAWILNREMGLDPVSAYLVATHGGLDSVAAVAAEVQGDTAVILTVHLVRLLCVLTVGPWLVRACSRWLSK